MNNINKNMNDNNKNTNNNQVIDMVGDHEIEKTHPAHPHCSLRKESPSISFTTGFNMFLSEEINN